MILLNKIKEYAEIYPERIAIKNDACSDNEISYKQFEEYSNRIAAYISAEIPDDNSPIIVYGSKSPYMLIMFIGCVKSGHPYCPVDISEPMERIESIINQIAPHIVFTTELLELKFDEIIRYDEIKKICEAAPCDDMERDLYKVSEENVFYVLFTSGSTGEPKGVEISVANIDSFLKWSDKMVGKYRCDDFVFLNQSPFSFDLSVMDIYTCFNNGGTLRIIDSSVQSNFKYMLEELKESHGVIWVSTPSLADMCLMSKKFTHEMMPRVKLFFFCGETLNNNTAYKLLERFPEAEVINAYGPTEATVAVTEQSISMEIAQKEEPLPVGKVKQDCWIEIWDRNGESVEHNIPGEIVIKGDSVGYGYFKKPELTGEKFVFDDKKRTRGYRTGDEGFMDEEGYLHYVGRIDTQIQFHGYRIELGEIENQLLKISFISRAAVIPDEKDNTIKRLVAFVVQDKINSNDTDANNIVSEIKEIISAKLPAYMIPKTVKIVDALPVNKNGKIDRKALKMMLE